jgi:hypothetical protein
MFMLPLDVMGPGGSLSTVLIVMSYCRDASWRESWQAATTMMADSCDRTAAVLVLWLGSNWRRQQWSSIGFDDDGFLILIVFIVL